MKKMLYLIWVVGALLVSFSSTFAQSNRHWDFAPDGFNIPQGQLMQAQLPKEYKLARLNVPALYQELSDAYRAPADAPPLLISIPNPEGGYSDFYISPTSVVADEVAHLYTVKTFKGYAKNSRQVTLRCDISPTGFHAAVFSGDVMYGAILPRAVTDAGQGVVHSDGAANHTGRCPARSSGQQAAGTEGFGRFLARGVADDVGGAKNGVKEVGRPSFAVEPIGGQTALIIVYGGTSTAPNPAETMRVTQYHVPLGAEKALITLSYIEGDQQAIAAHNRLKSSIVIR